MSTYLFKGDFFESHNLNKDTKLTVILDFWPVIELWLQ